MNKQKLLFVFLMLVTVCLLQSSAAAQTDNSDDLIPTKVLIINGSGSKIIFELRNENSDWKLFSLEAGSRESYTNAAWIRICTNSKCISGRVWRGYRYRIDYDASMSIWGYQRITPNKGRR